MIDLFGLGRNDSDPDTDKNDASGKNAARDNAPATYTEQEVLAREDRTARTLMAGVDKAVRIQAGTVVKYVEAVKKRNPKAGPREIQGIIDKHFKNVVSGTGAGAGAATAVPGVGFFTGIAAIGAESLVFLEAAAWYILASAHVRGIDVHDKEHRKALVLLVLTGSKGSAVVDTVVGDQGLAGLRTASSLSRVSGSALQGLNGRLTQLFLKQVTKRMRFAWLSKLMPLGIGAVLGTLANRKLGDQVIRHAAEQLDPLPASFPPDQGR